MSAYAELISAVTPLGFRAAMKGESDSDHLGRLALAASAMPDYEWSCLTAEAVEWVNASAKRLNLGKTVYPPSGFREIPDDLGIDPTDQVLPDELPALLRERDNLEGMGIAPGGHIDCDGKFVITEFSIVDPAQLRDPHCVIGKTLFEFKRTESLASNNFRAKASAMVSAEEVSSRVQPENIALDTSNADYSEDDPHGEMHAAGYPAAEPTLGRGVKIVANGTPLTEGTGYSLAGSTVKFVEPVVHALGRTDAIRALVMQHPEWTEEQLKAAGGDDVTRATLKTVRSVTLATIAVAKRLGLWRQA